MANIMAQNNLRNHVSRDGEDLSRRICFTSKTGEILPVAWYPILPGDKFKINLSSFGRTAPLQTASFARVRKYYDVYFVPYRLLWDKFPNWVIQTDQPTHAKNVFQPADKFNTSPYFTNQDLTAALDALKANQVDVPTGEIFDDGGLSQLYSTRKLLSYLGYSKFLNYQAGEPIIALNPFPLLAFQKIYQDYFRFQQWEKSAPWTYNLDYILAQGQLQIKLAEMWTGVTSSAGTVYRKTMISGQYCNYDKDYFNGLLPDSQFGESVQLNLQSSFPANSNLFPIGGLTGHFYNPSSSINDPKTLQFGSTTGSNKFVGSNSVPGGDFYLSRFNVQNFNNYPILTSLTSSLSILALRRAEVTQKWKEITQSGNLDYKDQIYKHWNEQVSDDQSYLSRYIGGISSNLDVSEVLNSNLTGDNQADIHGKGILSDNGVVSFDNRTNDYGILMVIQHTKPIIEWRAQDVVPKELYKVNADDYAIPEYDSVGMQPVLADEFGVLTNVQNPDVLGYAPRYIEYKTSYDLVLGEFQDTLKPWVLPYVPNYDFALDNSDTNYRTFKVHPSITNNMFGVAVDATTHTDQYYESLYLDVKAVRNLKRSGMPY